MNIESIKKLLPEVMQKAAIENSVLYCILLVMERLHVRPQEIINTYKDNFNPMTLDTSIFLEFIAEWLDFYTFYKYTIVDYELYTADSDDTIGEYSPLNTVCLSNLVSNAMTLYSLRGTADGILLALRLAIGSDAISIAGDTSGTTNPFHFTIAAHSTLKPMQLLIYRIVNFFKPVYSTFTLVFIKKMAPELIHDQLF